jgi:ubiquinone biosynthesis accessory factor UbiK
MIHRLPLEDLANKISALLPNGTETLTEDFRNHLKTLISSTLTRMDLVTREEFDVQAAVLARTRARLEALEKQVTELETRLSQPNPPIGG